MARGWFEERMGTSSARRDNEFWSSYLSEIDDLEPLELEGPEDAATPAVLHAHAEGVDAATLIEAARSMDVAIETMVHTAFAMVLSRYVGRADVVVGVSAGALLAPLRVQFDNRPVRELLQDVQRDILEITEHDQVTLAEIATWAGLEPQTRLFDTLVVFSDSAGPGADGPERGEPSVASSMAADGLALILHAGLSDELALSGVFDRSRFDPADITTLVGAVARTLVAIALDPAAPADTIDEITAITPVIDSPLGDPGPDSLWHRFESVVAAHPDQVALIDHDGAPLTYAEVAKNVAAVADRLRAASVGSGSIVAIAAPRSALALQAIYAIHAVGASYLAIAADQPMARIGSVLTDVGARLLLVPDPAGIELEAAITVADLEATALAPGEFPAVVEPDTVFVTLTSGSTGRPKAVPIHESAMLQRLTWQWERYPFDRDELAVAKSGLHFVDHQWEVWGALLQGVTTMIVPDSDLVSMDAFVQRISDPRVKRVLLVPSLLEDLLDQPFDAAELLGHVRWWTVSGEPLSDTLVGRFHQRLPDATLINIYGMSEADGDVTAGDSDTSSLRGGRIGTPLPGFSVTIVDPSMRRVPAGATGEIIVAGPGVTRGYLGGEGSDAFVERDGVRWYRTGDHGRIGRDGSVAFSGRRDSRLKIRGVRIEPGEIEAAIGELAGVRRAVVVANEGRLIAHVIADDPTLDSRALRASLVDSLPPGLIPSSFVLRDRLPTTSTGKLDRRRLESEELVVAHRVDGEPIDEMTAVVMAAMGEALEIDGFGPDDDFFDHGGHSLLALRAAAALEEAVEVKVPLAQFLLEPTPRGLAATISSGAMSDRLLVPISTGERELFLIHGGGGNVLNFRDLAHNLRPSIGVVGIQAVGADGLAEPLESVVEMADRYLEELVERQPTGPYLIGGFSGGGVIGLELASRLRNDGHQVDLILFDTYAPTATVQSITLQMHLRNLFAEGPQYLARRVQSRQAARERRQVAAGHPGLDPETLLDHRMNDATERAIVGFTPAVYDGPTLMLKVEREYIAFRHIGPDRGWGDLLPNLEIVEVPGDHDTMLDAGNVGVVAAKIQAWVGRA